LTPPTPRSYFETLNYLHSTHKLQGPTPALRPPHRATLPLWLALLLKRQRRANILPPPWLLPQSLDKILKKETDESPVAFSEPPPHPHPLGTHPSHTDTISPPFLPSSTIDSLPDYLPYHWLELGEILLEACPDDIPDPDRVRSLLRGLREVRMAKMRASVKTLEGGGLISLMGVGAMEISEGRQFIVGVMDGLRKLGESREVARRAREEDGNEGVDSDDEDMDMGFE
jgi:GINS complex subunit 2